MTEKLYALLSDPVRMRKQGKAIGFVCRKHKTEDTGIKMVGKCDQTVGICKKKLLINYRLAS